VKTPGRGPVFQKAEADGYKRSTHIEIQPTWAAERCEELQQIIKVVYFAPYIVQGRFSPAPADESI